ncbi:hypothetical protein NQ317_008170 [Molorchus minor]|uniref:Tetratricopeptide repeat protein 7 N-terminal domain-containing protein n=1 Tax=Molorchus minor TaxID=1323400 RepID=A0ABQ9J594_9CUCU|nr:hypothetical protein NQ317_008170 [Molorchus minor]
MTGRVKSGPTRIEVEIEKSREESNWIKVIELAEQLKDKSPDLEWPPVEANVHRAKIGLIDAKRYLNLVITEAGIKAGVAMDAHLLLGKLLQYVGQYSETLKAL